jgi:hypothetical protein
VSIFSAIPEVNKPLDGHKKFFPPIAYVVKSKRLGWGLHTHVHATRSTWLALVPNQARAQVRINLELGTLTHLL